jgi:hypothetical protein
LRKERFVLVWFKVGKPQNEFCAAHPLWKEVVRSQLNLAISSALGSQQKMWWERNHFPLFPQPVGGVGGGVRVRDARGSRIRSELSQSHSCVTRSSLRSFLRCHSTLR